MVQVFMEGVFYLTDGNSVVVIFVTSFFDSCLRLRWEELHISNEGLLPMKASSFLPLRGSLLHRSRFGNFINQSCIKMNSFLTPAS